jgi:hypothetical protein
MLGSWIVNWVSELWSWVFNCEAGLFFGKEVRKAGKIGLEAFFRGVAILNYT